MTQVNNPINDFSQDPSLSHFISFLRDSIRSKILNYPFTPVIVLKAKDIGDDRRAQTIYGRVLSAFCNLGFGDKANKRRPIRYIINHVGIRWAILCSWPNCDPQACPFRTICPYMRIAGWDPCP